VGEHAADILKAARAEAERRTLKVGETPVNPDAGVGVNS
jgi:hypothetical protein